MVPGASHGQLLLPLQLPLLLEESAWGRQEQSNGLQSVDLELPDVGGRHRHNVTQLEAAAC